MPDYTVEDTVYKRFTTRAFATGIPTTLAGTPVVSAYEDDSVTQITAGITLGVDHDSVTGLNLLTIVATGANGFEAGKSYDLVITTGTVGGVSVVGEVVWHFTLSAEAAAVDLANGTDGLGAIKTDTAAILVDTGTTLDGKIDTIDTNVDAILVDTGTTLDGKINTIDTNVDAILVDTGTTLDTKINDIQGATFSSATDSLEAIRDRGDAAWTTGAGGTPPHLLQTTTIATLATQTSFTLTAGSADDDAYNNAIAVITDSATSTQKAVATVSDYTGVSKTVTLSADPGIFTMAVGDTIDIMSALGAAGSAPTAAQVADAVLDEALAGHVAAGSLGKAVADIETDATAILADTADMQPKLGSPAADVSADIAAVKVDTAAVLVDTGTTIPGTISTIDTNVDAILVDTADMQPKLGTPAASVSADIAAVKAETALIVADTNELQTDDVPGLIAALNNLSVADVLTTALTEAYAVDGAAFTLSEALYMIYSTVAQSAVGGTSITAKRLDGTTTSMTFTTDDATNPTSRTRTG